jgi:hypothetical protein
MAKLPVGRMDKRVPGRIGRQWPDATRLEGSRRGRVPSWLSDVSGMTSHTVTFGV